MSDPDTPVLPVADLEVARVFYLRALGCRLVGTEPARLSLELHGHPLTLVEVGDVSADAGDEASFVLGVDDWCAASERLQQRGVDTTVEPGRRFSVEPGQQCALRLVDPDGNAIALRGFATEPDRLAA